MGATLVKLAFILVHLVAKAAPLLRGFEMASLFLPFKVAAVYALTLRDMLGLSAQPSLTSDVTMLTIAAALTGLLLWPKRPVPSGARQE